MKIKVEPLTEKVLVEFLDTEHVEENYQPAIIVKSLKTRYGNNQGYELSNFFYYLEPGNAIKMGRVTYYVIEMKLNGIVTYPQKKLKYLYQVPNIKSNEDSTNPCKICFDHSDTEENPLFNPCKCTGSCGTIHF